MQKSWQTAAPHKAVWSVIASSIVLTANVFFAPLAAAQEGSDGAVCSNYANLDQNTKMACILAQTMCIPSASAGTDAHRRCMDKFVPKQGVSPQGRSEGAKSACRHDFSADDKVRESSVKAAIDDCSVVIQTPGASDHDLAIAHAWRAIDLEFLGKNDEGGAEAEAAINLDPSLAEAYYARGIANYAWKKYDVAIAAFSKFLSLRPRSSGMREQAYLARGAIYVTVKQYEPAISDLSYVIRHDPRSAEAYYYRGVAEQQLGRTQAGDADIRAAERIDPNVGNGG